MEKDFDGWNLQKQQLDSSSSRFYTVREIWWCRLGLNIGTEQNGRGRKYFRPKVNKSRQRLALTAFVNVCPFRGRGRSQTVVIVYADSKTRSRTFTCKPGNSLFP